VPTTRPTVLLCDDAPGFRTMLSAFLHDTGLDVSVCATWEEGVACAAEQHPDAMVLDLWMPTFDPASLQEVCGSSPRSAVVIISALPVEESRRRIAGIAGIARVVSKRDHPDVLVAAVWDALASAGTVAVR